MAVEAFRAWNFVKMALGLSSQVTLVSLAENIHPFTLF
jgi:hypothetical protein